WAQFNVMAGLPSFALPSKPVASTFGSISVDFVSDYIAFGVNAVPTPAGAGIYRTKPAPDTDNAGGVYVYRLTSSGGPSFHAFIKTPNPDDGDAIGNCLAFGRGDITRLHVCAPGED